MSLIDEALPRCDRRELHRTRTTAPPEAVWAALQELPGAELKLMNALRAITRRAQSAPRTAATASSQSG